MYTTYAVAFGGLATRPPASQPYLVSGFRVTDHPVTPPLDHADPSGPTIEVFAREARGRPLVRRPPAGYGVVTFTRLMSGEFA